MPESKNILFAVLNWGIGHATRSIPLIQQLQQQHQIIIASDGIALEFLQAELPDIPTTSLPSYNITYAANGSNTWHLAKQLPHLVQTIQQEHQETQALVEKYHIDLIISDNRYGAYHADVPSVFITHQLQLRVPLAFVVNKKLRQWLGRFNHIWIPDTAQHALTGQLSQTAHALPTSCIGWQSRMKKQAETPSPISTPYVLAIVSGPEPQRAIFEGILIRSFIALRQQVVIVGGTSAHATKEINTHITYLPQVTGPLLHQYITHASHIICRSGYSTLMDLVAVQKTALLVPTPGQPEQEYLAQRFKNQFHFESVPQANLHMVSLQKYLSNPPSKLPTIPFTEFNILATVETLF